MFHFVYALESTIGDHLYIGYYPGNVQERLDKHNRGQVFSTKPYRPWRLIFYEAYIDQNDAIRREKYLKTSQGARLLKRMLQRYRSSRK